MCRIILDTSAQHLRAEGGGGGNACAFHQSLMFYPHHEMFLPLCGGGFLVWFFERTTPHRLHHLWGRLVLHGPRRPLWSDPPLRPHCRHQTEWHPRIPHSLPIRLPRQFSRMKPMSRMAAVTRVVIRLSQHHHHHHHHRRRRHPLRVSWRHV
jgi:hypothetical protein